MKTFLQLTTCLLLATLIVRAAEPSITVKDAVLRAESDWKTAVLRSNRATLEKLLSADLSYTHSSSKTQTREQFIEDVTGGATVYKSIDFENTKVRQYGDVVVITHAATIVTVQTGTSHLYLTEVWAKQDSGWQMVSRQATKLP